MLSIKFNLLLLFCYLIQDCASSSYLFSFIFILFFLHSQLTSHTDIPLSLSHFHLYFKHIFFLKEKQKRIAEKIYFQSMIII